MKNLLAGLVSDWKGKLAVGVTLVIAVGLILTKWVNFAELFK